MSVATLDRCSRSGPTAASRRSTWGGRAPSSPRSFRLITIAAPRSTRRARSSTTSAWWTRTRGLVDTLPHWRRTVAAAGLEATVVGIVGDSRTVAAHWNTPLALVFVDGSHSPRAATNDYEGWAPRIMRRGLLVVHDVFPDPAEGGRPPTKSIDALLAPVPKVDQRSSMRASPASPSNTPPSTG